MASKVPIMLLLLATLVVASAATTVKYNPTGSHVLSTGAANNGRRLLGSANVPVELPPKALGTVIGAGSATYNLAIKKAIRDRKLMSTGHGAAESKNQAGAATVAIGVSASNTDISKSSQNNRHLMKVSFDQKPANHKPTIDAKKAGDSGARKLMATPVKGTRQDANSAIVGAQTVNKP